MPHAIRFEKAGGPEVLLWKEVAVGKPGQGQVRLRHNAVGLNYIDTYHRSGLYQLPMPSGLGSEGAGIVEEVGPGVSGLKPGDRVAYAGGPIGAYADERVMPTERLVPVPDGITDQQAAAMMLKGMTAWYLIRRTHPVKRGESILIHAAAGGVGLIVCQWAKHLGATVIGTVGDEEKAALAKQNGCDYPILYKHEDFVAKVCRNNQGQEASGSLRLRRQGYFLQVARLSGAAGADGIIRPVFGSCRTGRHRHPRRQGIAVSDPADLEHLYGNPRGPTDRRS
jgi:NADPH2:quinone reductase